MTSAGPHRSWFDRQPGFGPPWTIAHRGASALAAENSTAAFEAAIAAGADAIETDVRLTKDNCYVCHHDADLVRTSGLDAAVADLTLDELRNASRLPVVTLDAVLALVPARCRLLLDLKITAAPEITRMAALLQPHAEDGAVAVGIRSLAAQAILAGSVPALPLLGLLDDSADFPAFRAAGGSWARLWEEDATASRIAVLRALLLPVVIMAGRRTHESVGRVTPERLAALLALAPDAIMLDDPTLPGQIVAAQSRPSNNAVDR